MERQSTSKLFRIAIAIVAFFVLCTSSLLFASCGTTTASTGCEHEFDFSKPNETIQATCGRPGSAVYTCAKCGESVSVVIQLATGNHKTENGVCTECGQTVADTGLTQAQFEAKVSEIQATLSGLATKSIESTVSGVKDAVDALKEQLTNGLKSLSTEVAAGGKVDESKISSAIESAVENSLKELGNLVKPGDLSQVEQNIEDYIKNHVEGVLSTLDGGVDGLETALKSCLQTQYFNDQLTILQTTLLDTIKSYIETEVGKVQTTLTNTLGAASLPEVKDTVDKVLEALVGSDAPAAAPGATTEPNSITGYLKSLWTALYGTGAADAGNGLIEEVKSVSGDIANLQRDVMAVLGDKDDEFGTDETIFAYLKEIYAQLNATPEGCVAHTWITTPVAGQEDLNPCLDAVKCNYVCAVCGAHLQKEGEDKDVEVTMYPTGHVLDWNHAATEAADEDTDHYQHATCITPAHAEAWCVVCEKYTGEWTYQGKPTGQHHYVLESTHKGDCEIEQTLVYHCATCGGAYVLEGVGGGSGVDLNGKHNYYVKLDENENLTKEALTTEDPQYAAAVEEYKKDHGITDRDLTTNELYDALRKHLNVVSESPATCTEPGLIVVECAYCGMRYAYSWGEPLGHHFSKSLRPGDKDTATCTQDGVKDYYYCPQCGYYFDNTTGVPTYLTDEDGQKIYGEAADKDASHWTDGTHSIEAKEDAIKAKALKAASDPAKGHKFDKYVKTVDATCENGERYVLVCSVCGTDIEDAATVTSNVKNDPADCDLTKAWNAVKDDTVKASEWLAVHGYFNTADEEGNVVADFYTDDDVPVLDPAKVADYIAALGVSTAADLAKYYTGTNELAVMAQPVTGHTFTSVLVIEQYTCEVDGCYILVCNVCGAAETYEADATQDHPDITSKKLTAVKYQSGKTEAKKDAANSDLEALWKLATDRDGKVNFLKKYGYFNIFKTVAEGVESWDDDAIEAIEDDDLDVWFTKTGETYHDADNNLGCEKLLAKNYGHLYKNGYEVPGEDTVDQKKPRISCWKDVTLDNQFTAELASSITEAKLNADFKAAQEAYGITDYCTRNHCPLKNEEDPRYTGGYAAARDHEMGYFMYQADKSGNRTETVVKDYIFNNNEESVYTDPNHPYVCPNTGDTYESYKEDPFNLKNINEKWAESNSNGAGGLVSPLSRTNKFDFDGGDIEVQALSGALTSDGAPTCWFTYRCRWYNGVSHEDGGCNEAGAEQPTHVTPTATDDPYYWANCQHGSHCTVCGALTSPRTRHTPVIVTEATIQELLHTLVAGEQEGGKTVEDALRESLGDICADYEEWFLDETCEKDGYVFWFCMGELELLRDGKSVTRWNKIDDVTSIPADGHTEGNYAIQVLEKHAHGSLTEPAEKAGWITVCYDYETQTIIDGAKVTESCIEGYYYIDYCKECAEKQEGYVESGELPQDIVWVMEGGEKVYYKVKLANVRVDTTNPDEDVKTNSDGMYKIHAPGKHQVAPVKGYTSIPGYKPATETSPAYLTVECTVCGTRLWISWDKESAERANVEFIADKLAEHTTDKFYADVQPLEGVDNKIEVKKNEVTKVPEILENSLKGDGKGAHVVLPEGKETITVENSKVMPKAGQEVVIELNGNTLQLGTDFEQATGEITLKDGSVTVPDNWDNFGANGADAKLTLENVTVTGGETSTLYVGDGATLTVSGSTIVSKESTAFMTNADHGPVTINLTESTFISATTDIGVVINVDGTVTAEKCKFVGGASGVWVRGNGAKVEKSPLDVTFTDCEFYTRLEGEWHTNQNWEGGTHMPDDIGAGIVIGDGKTNSEYGSVESVKLNGCKFGIVKMNTDDTNTWTTDNSKQWGSKKGQQPVVLALNSNNTINVTFDETTWTNLKTGEAEYVFNTDTNLYLEDGSTIAQATVKHGETVVQLNTITLTGDEKESVQTEAKEKIEALAKQGGNITLPKLEGDPATVTLDGETKIEEDTTIELNGNTLKGKLDVKDGAHLTVKGGTYEGTLYALAADKGEGSRVTLEGVTTKAEGEKQHGLSIAPTAENGSSVKTKIVVDITDSRIEGEIGLVVNGRMDGAIINITNSAILGNNGCGLSVCGKAEINAKNSVFFGSATAVQMASGKGSFTDCTFVSAKDNFGKTEFGENTYIPTATLGNFVINSRGGGYDSPVDVTLAGANTKFITAKMHSGYAVSNVFAASETGEQKTLLTWGTEEKEIGYYEVEAEASEKVTITVVEATPTAASAERVKLTITDITGLSFKVATNVFVYTNDSTDGSASVELAAVQAMVKGVAISAKDA